MLRAIWRFVLRLFSLFDRIPAEDCIPADSMQKYMLESEAEWQVAYLEYCWLLDASKHYYES